LSDGARILNRVISRVRVKVEHVLAGVKRSRIVKEVFRLTKQNISDLVMEIACGLHNLRVSIRHPLKTINLLDFLETG
jgi:hypothetical protein